MSLAAKSNSAPCAHPANFRAVALRGRQRCGRARRGVGAQRPGKYRRQEQALSAGKEIELDLSAWAKCSNAEVNQFHVPRKARIANNTAEGWATSPRSCVGFQELPRSSGLRGHQHQNAWPNPSFELTHYSKALGPRGAFVYHAPHGPIPSLPWAAQFQR